MPHAATQCCVSVSESGQRVGHAAATAASICPIPTAPLGQPDASLSATCVGVAARRRCCLALKLCPSFSSDFLWFWLWLWLVGRWETTTKLAAKLHLLRLAATTYMADRTGTRASTGPGQRQVQSSLERQDARTACEVFNSSQVCPLHSCLMPKCSHIFDFICFDQ